MPFTPVLNVEYPSTNDVAYQDTFGTVINALFLDFDAEHGTWTVNKDAANFALSNANIKRGYCTPYSVGNISGAVTVDCNNGNVQYATATGNISSLTINNFPDGGTLTLVITQDGTGSRTLTYSAGTYKTQGGSTLALSTAASSVDHLFFRKINSIINFDIAKNYS
jgi:hypothetical protein